MMGLLGNVPQRPPLYADVRHQGRPRAERPTRRSPGAKESVRLVRWLDPALVRTPRKARVENQVPCVRESWFDGENVQWHRDAHQRAEINSPRATSTRSSMTTTSWRRTGTRPPGCLAV